MNNKSADKIVPLNTKIFSTFIILGFGFSIIAVTKTTLDLKLVIFVVTVSFLVIAYWHIVDKAIRKRKDREKFWEDLRKDITFIRNKLENNKNG